MARQDNPFSLFEADDDEVDPVAILARAETKKLSEARAAAEREHQRQQEQQVDRKNDSGGRAEKGSRGGRGGRGRGGGRAGGDSWDQYGDGYFRGNGDGWGARGGRGGRGGRGRGRGRGYYEDRGLGDGDGHQYGDEQNQAENGGGAAVEEGEVRGGRRGGWGGRGGRGRGRIGGYYEDGRLENGNGDHYDDNRNQVQDGGEVQARSFYGYNRGRGYRSENGAFDNENRVRRWEVRRYGGEGRRYGGQNEQYEQSESQNDAEKKEDGGEGETQDNGNAADGGSVRNDSENAGAPKDADNEALKDVDVQKANIGPTSTEDAFGKKSTEEDNTMTLEEYEKLLFEKRKALEALKTESRKVDVNLDKSFGGMTLVEKKKEETIFIKKLEKDKLKKDSFDKEEKAHKAMSINEFLKPAEGEAYRGPSYARERAARIRAERQLFPVEEDGPDGRPAGNYFAGRGRGRGRGERGGYRAESDESPISSSHGARGRASRGRGGGGFGGGIAIPSGSSESVQDKEFLEKEFPVLGGAVKA